MAEAMRAQVASMLKGIDRYNPDNLSTLERYVEVQARENAYDLEANLAVLKLYQFNTTYYQSPITVQILLKALTNLPHTDFVLCKCLIDQVHIDDPAIQKVKFLAESLETCEFKAFWHAIDECREMIEGINGFEDSIRKFICHVVGITYQTIEKTVLIELLGGISEPQLKSWMNKYGWKELPDRMVFIANQEESIKTKNITEKIDFESVSGIMATCRTWNSHPNPFHLTLEQESWIGSAMAPGGAVGALLGGFLVDKVGRKCILVTGITPCVVVWVVMTTSSNFWMLLTGRLLNGLGCMCEQTAVTVYLAEMAPEDIRGRLQICVNISIGIGVVLIYLSGSLLPWKRMSTMRYRVRLYVLAGDQREKLGGNRGSF